VWPLRGSDWPRTQLSSGVRADAAGARTRDRQDHFATHRTRPRTAERTIPEHARVNTVPCAQVVGARHGFIRLGLPSGDLMGGRHRVSSTPGIKSLVGLSACITVGLDSVSQHIPTAPHNRSTRPVRAPEPDGEPQPHVHELAHVQRRLHVSPALVFCQRRSLQNRLRPATSNSDVEAIAALTAPVHRRSRARRVSAPRNSTEPPIQ